MHSTRKRSTIIFTLAAVLSACVLLTDVSSTDTFENRYSINGPYKTTTESIAVSTFFNASLYDDIVTVDYEGVVSFGDNLPYDISPNVLFKSLDEIAPYIENGSINTEINIFRLYYALNYVSIHLEYENVTMTARYETTTGTLIYAEIEKRYEIYNVLRIVLVETSIDLYSYYDDSYVNTILVAKFFASPWGIVVIASIGIIPILTFVVIKKRKVKRTRGGVVSS